VVERIVSGGQTGADRGALDAAIELGIETGGWVPRGRRAEDGSIPERYSALVEASSEDYDHRTKLNVRDSDATLILSHGPLSGGSELTLRSARSMQRPVLHLDLDATPRETAIQQLREWLTEVAPRTLNVAGPRASSDPLISRAARDVLLAALR
jgi:hypothetical protein